METPSSLSLATVWALHVGGTLMPMPRDTAGQCGMCAKQTAGMEAGWGSPVCLQVSAAETVWDVPSPPATRGEQVPRCLGDKGK